MAAAESPRKRPTNGTQRRHNKPLIEKRRRARINECLAQLQSLVLKATSTEVNSGQGPRPSKLEKADILEMTVDYIKKTRNGSTEDVGVVSQDPDVQKQYVAGYEKCVKEVMQFLEKHNNIGTDIRQKISSHCQDKLREKSTQGEPMEGIKCERSDDESDDLSRSRTPTPELPKSTTPVDVAKPEERPPVLNTAYVAPLQQQQQTSPEVSPMKQATLQQVSGPIKLVCGGDILILLDSSSAAQNQVNPPAIPKIQFSQPSAVPSIQNVYQTCSVNMSTGSVAPAPVPFPMYRLSNLPVAGIPLAGAIPNIVQPIHSQSEPQNILKLPQENVIINQSQPLAEECHVAVPQCNGPMWRPW